MTIRLLVSDVDGTLVRTDKSLAPSTIDAVRRLREAGTATAIVSARPPRGMKPIAAELGLDTPLAGFNGGTLLGQDGAIVSQLLLPPEAARTAIDLFTRRDIWTWLFTSDEWLCTDPAGPKVPLERHTVRFDERVVDDYGPYLGQVGKLTGVTDDHERLAAVETELQSLLGLHAAVHRSQPYYLDVTHPDAHKGNAVRFLARAMGLDPQDVAAIGDGANDVPMFGVAGHAIAMGNAAPDVQARAGWTTGTNDADGWAQAADRLIVESRESR